MPYAATPGAGARDALAGAATASEVAVAVRAKAMVAVIVVSLRDLAVIVSSKVVAREVNVMTVTVPPAEWDQRRLTSNKLWDLVSSGLGKLAPRMVVSQAFRECQSGESRWEQTTPNNGVGPGKYESPGPTLIISGEGVSGPTRQSACPNNWDIV